MTDKYNPQEIEQKWQGKWDTDKLYRSEVDWSRPKHYALTMLPYPSGDLHMGHWYAMTPSDARARYMRMKGYNVLFPMGFDAFGLPAENAAIQRGIDPRIWTYDNINRMRVQFRSMGTMFDWEREMVSCDPDYYKWTEWFFKTFYENDLAYRGEALVNWSDALQTVLANEQVIDGKDERLGQPVIQKLMTQWFFRYTRYADELLKFEDVDWPEAIKTMQTNWIGRSEGAHVTFHTEGGDPILIYTTRPDTLWGATFMVLAPEHPLVEKITTAENAAAVKAYQAQAAKQTEIERTAENKEKTGVWTGAYAINPVNGAKIPVWIADYVMISYGSGAIMAVPAHDERDFAFARKFGLPVIAVISPDGEALDGDTMPEAYVGGGVMINSAQFDGTVVTADKGRKNPGISAVLDWLAEKGIGKEAVNYRLRDWLISRQRYWGSPIPIIYRQDGGIETVPDDQLPVLLPDKDVKFMGPSPLKVHEEFRSALDSDGNPADRETDTMDTFMCSSWYWYRYLSPHHATAPFDPEEAAYWLPVDTYTGGAEHATMHLLYARWFAKAMRDLGVFDETVEIMRDNDRDPALLMLGEPFMQLRNQGQILGEERNGDVIAAVGVQDGNRVVAHKIVVLASNKPTSAGDVDTRTGATAPTAGAGEIVITGEIMRRTERTLQVAALGADWTTVEVAEDAEIDIPNIPGANTVNQLKQHLEIQRMSKSKGNVVNPDDLVQQYGADTVRAYLMFNFDWEKGGPWDSHNIIGVVRWLNDVWDLVLNSKVTGEGTADGNRRVERKVHQTIEKVTAGLEDFRWNSSIAGLMELRNELRAAVRDGVVGRAVWEDAVITMLLMMSPFTPHVAEELWMRIGQPYSVHTQKWPVYDPDKATEDTVTLVVQAGKRVIDTISVPVNITEEDAKRIALESDGARKLLNGSPPSKVIYIAGKGKGGKGGDPVVNIVV